MTEKQTTRKMIDYCKARIKETKPLKGNYYKKVIKSLRGVVLK